MQGFSRAALAIFVIFLAAGCSSLPGRSPSDSQTAMDLPFVAAASNGACEPLGALTALADCDCYDKMSYDSVRNLATENLYREAQVNYPTSNVVEISSVNLYLNRAVAKGVAYRCPSVSSY